MLKLSLSYTSWSGDPIRAPISHGRLSEPNQACTAKATLPKHFADLFPWLRISLPLLPPPGLSGNILFVFLFIVFSCSFYLCFCFLLLVSLEARAS